MGNPLAVLIGVVVSTMHRLGHLTAAWTRKHTALRTVLCAVAVGVCISAYALTTGRSPAEAALSGQATLAVVAGQPHTFAVSALILLVLFKGLAWGICLGSLRGGPIFPAVLMGAAAGIAASGLPGLGTTAGLALGVATATAVVTRLPVTSSVLAVLLLGHDARNQAPLIVLCAVVGFITAEIVERIRKSSS